MLKSFINKSGKCTLVNCGVLLRICKCHEMPIIWSCRMNVQTVHWDSKLNWGRWMGNVCSVLYTPLISIRCRMIVPLRIYTWDMQVTFYSLHWPTVKKKKCVKIILLMDSMLLASMLNTIVNNIAYISIVRQDRCDRKSLLLSQFAVDQYFTKSLHSST